MAGMIGKRGFRVFTTRELLEELARVLGYQKISRVLAARGITPADIIRIVVENSIIVMAKPLGETVITAAPADDAVLACAVTAGAECIISGDAHLTALGSFRGIPIMTPSQFIEKNH